VIFLLLLLYSMMLMVVARVLLVVVMWFLTAWVKRNSPLSLCDILAVAALEHVVDGGC